MPNKVSNSYSTGNYADDTPTHRGWFIGTFISEGAARTSDVEILEQATGLTVKAPSDPNTK